MLYYRYKKLLYSFIIFASFNENGGGGAEEIADIPVNVIELKRRGTINVSFDSKTPKDEVKKGFLSQQVSNNYLLQNSTLSCAYTDGCHFTLSQGTYIPSKQQDIRSEKLPPSPTPRGKVEYQNVHIEIPDVVRERVAGIPPAIVSPVLIVIKESVDRYVTENGYPPRVEELKEQYDFMKQPDSRPTPPSEEPEQPTIPPQNDVPKMDVPQKEHELSTNPPQNDVPVIEDIPEERIPLIDDIIFEEKPCELSTDTKKGNDKKDDQVGKKGGEEVGNGTTKKGTDGKSDPHIEKQSATCSVASDTGENQNDKKLIQKREEEILKYEVQGLKRLDPSEAIFQAAKSSPEAFTTLMNKDKMSLLNLDDTGKDPLHFFAYNFPDIFIEMVKSKKISPADVNLKDKFGYTAAEYAEKAMMAKNNSKPLEK